MTTSETRPKCVATCEVKYTYFCERCGRQTPPFTERISRAAVERPKLQSGGRFVGATTVPKPGEADKTARSLLSNTVDKLKAAVKSSRGPVFMTEEPFLAQAYNEVFAGGTACPNCGTRQSWYPAYTSGVSFARSMFSYGITLMALCAALACLLNIFVAPSALMLILLPLVGALSGVFSGYIHALAVVRRRKVFGTSVVRSRRPIVDWGETTVKYVDPIAEEMLNPEKDNSAASESGDVSAFVSRRANIKPEQRDALMIWKLRKMNHPNILHMHDIISDGDGGSEIIEEKFDGVPLSELIKGDIKEGALQDVLLQLCDALTYLHTHEPSITHNQVSSRNILVGAGNEIKLTNFDAATLDDSHAADIAAVGKILRKVKAKYVKKYMPLIQKCNGGYESIEELRGDLTPLLRPSYLKYLKVALIIIMLSFFISRIVRSFA